MSHVVLVTIWTLEGFKLISLSEEITAVMRWNFTIRALPFGH